MGIEIERPENDRIIIHGKGLHGLKSPDQALDVGNSGTTIRLLSGILAAQDFNTKISGDDSICRRPMGRIIKPLTLMGADIVSKENNDCAPLYINGSKLHGIHYESPIASAQVKSSILFAGMYADSETSVTEPYISRNHSEKMIQYFGGDITTVGTTHTLIPHPKLEGQKVVVPGDISSAAYFITAGLIVEGSEILVKNVGINPTRDGIIKVVQAMGGNITPTEDGMIIEGGTPLKGAHIQSFLDHRIAMSFAIAGINAQGETTIENAQCVDVSYPEFFTTLEKCCL